MQVQSLDNELIDLTFDLDRLDRVTYLSQVIRRDGPFVHPGDKYPKLEYSAATLRHINRYLEGELVWNIGDEEEFIEAMQFLLFVQQDVDDSGDAIDYPINYWTAVLHERYWNNLGPMRVESDERENGIFELMFDDVKGIVYYYDVLDCGDRLWSWVSVDEPGRHRMDIPRRLYGSRRDCRIGGCGVSLGFTALAHLLDMTTANRSYWACVDFNTCVEQFDIKHMSRILADSHNCLVLANDTRGKDEIHLQQHDNYLDAIYNQPTGAQRCAMSRSGVLHCSATFLWSLERAVDIVTPESIRAGSIANSPLGFVVWNITQSPEVEERIKIGPTSLPLFEDRGKLERVESTYAIYENGVDIFKVGKQSIQQADQTFAIECANVYDSIKPRGRESIPPVILTRAKVEDEYYIRNPFADRTVTP